MRTDRAEPRTYVPVRVHTPIGWIAGRLAMPEGQRLGEHLDHAGAHLRLVEVALPGRIAPADFFALQKNAATLVVPEAPIELERREGSVAHAIACLFDAGMLYGTLDVPPGVRLSDYLTTAVGYLPIVDCRLRSFAAEAPEQRFAVAFVHPARVIGFSERSTAYPTIEGLEK